MTHSEQEERSGTELYSVLILMCLLIVFVIVGNCIVIGAILFYRRLRKAQNMFLVSLACADLSVAILVMPFHVIYYYKGEWVFGKVWCCAWLTADVLFCSASIFNLAVISLERYLVIQNPLKSAKYRTVKSTGLLIGAGWLSSILNSLPSIVSSKDGFVDNGVSRHCHLNRVAWYNIYSSCFSFFIPLIFIVYAYMKIFTTIQNSLKKAGRIETRAFFSLSQSTNNTAYLNFTECKTFTQPEDSIIRGKKGKGGENVSGIEDGRAHVQSDCTDRKEITYTVFNHCKCSKSHTSPETADSVHEHEADDKERIFRHTSPETADSAHEQEADDKERISRHTSPETTDSAHEQEADDKERIFRHTSPETTDSAHEQETGDMERIFRDDFLRTESTVSTERKRVLIMKERKAATMLGIVTMAFVVCWLPFFVFFLISAFWEPPMLLSVVEPCVVWLGYINSCLNPLIYALFTRDLKKTIKPKLSRLCQCPVI